MNISQSIPKALTVCGEEKRFQCFFSSGIAPHAIHVLEISVISSLLQAPEHLPTSTVRTVLMPQQKPFLPASKKAINNPEMLKVEENGTHYFIKTILVYDKQKDCRVWILIWPGVHSVLVAGQDKLSLLPRAELIFMAILKIMAQGNQQAAKLCWLQLHRKQQGGKAKLAKWKRKNLVEMLLLFFFFLLYKNRVS